MTKTNLNRQQLINFFSNFKKRNKPEKLYEKFIESNPNEDIVRQLKDIIKDEHKHDRKKLARMIRTFFRKNKIGRMPHHIAGWISMKLGEEQKKARELELEESEDIQENVVKNEEEETNGWDRFKIVHV